MKLNESYQSNLSYPEFDLTTSDVLSLLCYPRFESQDYYDRLIELRSLGVEKIIFDGPCRLYGLKILGKGCVGIVVKVIISNKICALKIRRTDANRKTMENENIYLSIANSIGIGPKLLSSSKNFILMEYKNGLCIYDWFDYNASHVDKTKDIISSLFNQSFNLDCLGLDHGQLSNIKSHVIIENNFHPCIIDFETSSTVRNTKNLTSIVQAILFNNRISTKVNLNLNRLDVINRLREYKQKPSESTFKNILSLIDNIGQ